MIAGRYLNEFERREGVWKILSHTIVMDWSTNQPTRSGGHGMFKALRINHGPKKANVMMKAVLSLNIRDVVKRYLIVVEKNTGIRPI
jgi:hypothetical protein